MKAPYFCGSWGIRTPGTVKPVRQFSKLVVSATHPNFLKARFLKRDAKVRLYFILAKHLARKNLFFLNGLVKFLHFRPVRAFLPVLHQASPEMSRHRRLTIGNRPRA